MHDACVDPSNTGIPCSWPVTSETFDEVYLARGMFVSTFLDRNIIQLVSTSGMSGNEEPRLSHSMNMTDFGLNQTSEPPDIHVSCCDVTMPIPSPLHWTACNSIRLRTIGVHVAHSNFTWQARQHKHVTLSLPSQSTCVPRRHRRYPALRRPIKATIVAACTAPIGASLRHVRASPIRRDASQYSKILGFAS